MNCGGRCNSVMLASEPSSASAAAMASSTVSKGSKPQRLATSKSFTPAKKILLRYRRGIAVLFHMKKGCEP